MKTVIITGVAGGIGLAVAEEFRSAGWHVWGVDQHPADGVVLLDRFIPGDVSQEAFWQDQVVRRATAEGQKFDALINMAAVQVVKPLVETTAAEWDRVMAVNLRGPFLAMKSLVDLLSGHGAAVVNVSSVHAQATSREIAAYAASKGGLMALTRAAALEFAEQGIRVNALLPGAVRTSMLDAGLSGRGAQADLVGKLASLAAQTPLQRIGQPAEIARAVRFLADSEQSSFMTGQALVVDGGALARLSTE